MEQLRIQAENLERSGEYGRVAEIRYGQIPQAEQKIQEAQAQLDEIQERGALLKEEIDPEDIAEIVSRWTGIPVAKMLAGERDKAVAARRNARTPRCRTARSAPGRFRRRAPGRAPDYRKRRAR